MTKTKSTKKALLASVLALVMCVAMLVGSTFAWFTDSVSSTNNIIKSGRLDVELEYSTDATNWAPVTSTTNIFKADALWEPGYTEVVYLKVSNKGNLALKYNLGVNIASEIGSKNVLGKDFKLSDYIYFGTKDGASTYASRDAAIADVAAEAKKISAGYSKTNALNTQGASDIITMVVYMPTTVGNEANYAEGAAVPTIKFGINLIANQVEFESDGFNTNDYDAAATVDSEAELNAAIANGESLVVLGSSFEVTDSIVIPANKAVIIDLAGCTISQTKACTASYQMISNNGSLIIKDSIGNGKISFTDSGLGDTGNSWASYTIRNSGTLIVDGGTIEHLGTQSGNLNNAIFSYSGSVTINGGVVSAEYSRSLRQWSGDATINGGTFQGQVWVQAQGDCSFTITDGSFRPAAYGNDSSSVYVTPNGKNVTVAISGGNFATKLGMATPIKGVTGGTFGADPSAFVVDGYGVLNNDGKYTVVEGIVVTTLADLQDKLNNAQDGDKIVLGANITGEVTFQQKKNTTVSITIDGMNHTLAGNFYLSGSSEDNMNESLVIKNINFVCDKAAMGAIDSNNWTDRNGTRYAHNVTVENCTFTMTGAAYRTANAVDLYQPYNFTMKNCTVTGAHSALQSKGGHHGISVENVTATDCNNGIAVGTMDGAVKITGCILDVDGYGFRAEGDEDAAGATFTDCAIKANIPVVVRKTGSYGYSLTFNGTNTMTETNTEGIWCAIGVEEYGDVDKAGLTLTNNVPVVINDTGLNAAGVYGAKN